MLTTSLIRDRGVTRRVLPAAVRSTAVLAAAGLVLTACGSSDSSTDAGASSGSSGSATEGVSSSVEKVDSIAQMLPDSITQAGSITIAAEIYPPAVAQESDGAEPTGWDIENARAIAAVLGLDVEFQIIPFDGIVPGLQADRFDAAVGEIYITPERTASVTFVSNHESRDAMLVPAGSDLSGDSQDDLCGLTLAAQLGSAEADLLQTVADQCEADGKDAVTVQTFQNQSAVNLALQGGRIDGAVSSASQVANVLQQTDDQFELIDLPWAPSYNTGVALATNSDTAQLAAAIQAATQHLIDDGTLQAILDADNDGQGAIDTAEILPAPAGS